MTENPIISIVDDHSLTRAAIEDIVKSLGFSARTFASAESFLRSSTIAETDCLILDVQMPQMSGIELQDQLFQNGFDIPIIFVTAYPDEAIKTRALDAGAAGFLRKPLGLEELRLALQLALGTGRGHGPAI